MAMSLVSSDVIRQTGVKNNHNTTFCDEELKFSTVLELFSYQVSQEKILYLINNRTNGFSSIFRTCFVLDKAYPNLEFEIMQDC